MTGFNESTYVAINCDGRDCCCKVIAIREREYAENLACYLGIFPEKSKFIATFDGKEAIRMLRYKDGKGKEVVSL